ncbi:hypothetical protein NCS52_01294800 [Fusarium sp. LHS14.1]|nr:hypothetical protein NCS52_01294800 [Fusarium sp. LHS14.1]
MGPVGFFSVSVMVIETLSQLHRLFQATERDLRQPVEALQQTRKADLESLSSTLDSLWIVPYCASNTLETRDCMKREIERLKEHCARLYRNQSISPQERRGESDALHLTRPISLASGNFSQEMRSSLEKELSQILMASCQEHDRHNTEHGSKMGTESY